MVDPCIAAGGVGCFWGVMWSWQLVSQRLGTGLVGQRVGGTWSLEGASFSEKPTRLPPINTQIYIDVCSVCFACAICKIWQGFKINGIMSSHTVLLHSVARWVWWHSWLTFSNWEWMLLNLYSNVPKMACPFLTAAMFQRDSDILHLISFQQHFYQL